MEGFGARSDVPQLPQKFFVLGFASPQFGHLVVCFFIYCSGHGGVWMVKRSSKLGAVVLCIERFELA